MKTDEFIELTIEKLAGLGDGVGRWRGKKVFAAFTLPGDKVRGRIAAETSEAIHLSDIEVLEPGDGRISPVCAHFAICGGCALQHLKEERYREFKAQQVRDAVRRAGYDPGLVRPLVALPAASRRRVELKAVAGRLGYFRRRSHELVALEECPVLEPDLLALVLALGDAIRNWPEVTGIQINGLDEGYDVLMEGRLPVDADVSALPHLRRLSLQEGQAVRPLFQAGPATLTIGKVAVEPHAGVFLQAARASQAEMTRLVTQALAETERVLDLFAGIGTYGFALAEDAAVTAVEGDADMVRAMQAAAARHGLGERFRATQRDLFRRPVTASELAAFDGIVVNPPRAGAREQTQELARTSVAKLVMVSCNPATFARDARDLQRAGYALQEAVPIDQFVFSPHVELVAVFRCTVSRQTN